MPLNSALINHELDGEEYENAAPTLGKLMLAHFSTPDQHSPIVFGADCEFFATHPGRRFYLREAFANEWDVWTGLEDFQKRPKLWILVSLLAEGYHELTPRWRGDAFWHELETDQAVARTLLNMSLREGMRLSEWYAFITDQRVRKADAAKHRKGNRNVN